ncbi:MAG: extracellular solute-binding protein, partial [Syntrophales bacterium]|nr:extracellular solute-binding protein [Syntrophales bacterium]
MKKLTSFAVLITTLIVVTNIGKPLAAPAATSSFRPDIKASSEKTGGSWETEWNRVVEAAKKEGKVMIYSTPGGDVIRAAANAFEKKYGIKVDWINGRGEELAQRIQTEKVAGIRAVDVIMSGDGTTITVMKPRGLLGRIGNQLILPEVKDPQSWITNRVPYFDKDQTGIGMLATFQRYVLLNT